MHRSSTILLASTSAADSPEHIGIMTNRKIFLIVGAVLAVIVLLVVVFAGAIVGFALYSIGNSQAAEAARTFLRNNEKLKSDIGEVKDFGSIVTGSINISNDSGQATINIKVIGSRDTVNASVTLVFIHGQDWRVISAYYVNKSGQTISLQDPYDTRVISFRPQKAA
jgi:uncharacterized membrane protein